MNDVPDVYLSRTAQAAYPLLHRTSWELSARPLDEFGPFADVIKVLREVHALAAQLSMQNGKLYDAWADAQSAWEGLRTSDDGAKQYGLLDEAIRRIGWALEEDDLAAPPLNGVGPGKQSLINSADAPSAKLAQPARGQLNPLPANDLMAMDIPAPRQFVEGLIREGLSFFIGQPGVGKTPALVQLAIALATGGLWLGVFRLPRIRVAYIGPEYDRGDIRNIIAESTGGQVALDNLIVFTIENFHGPQTEEEALTMIDELVGTYRVEAIIVDLFPGFLPPEKFKQNAYRGDYREFLAYHRAALAHHIMMTGAWHGTKRDTNPASMYNGGQGFWGAAGGGRLVMYQDEEDQVKLWAQLRGNKPIAYTVSESFIAGCRLWAILEGSIPEPTFGSDIHRAIYRTIREHAPAAGLTPKVIASLVRPDLTTTVNDAYIRKCIGVLHKRGLLHAIGDSYVTASLKSAGSQGSQGSQGSHSQKGSRGSEGSGAWYEPESDPSDPSPIPSPIPSDPALDCGKSTSDPSDPQLLAIPDFSEGSGMRSNGAPVGLGHQKSEYPELDPIPREKHSTTLMMLVSPLERNQKLARERCEEHGIDYEAAHAWALEQTRKGKTP